MTTPIPICNQQVRNCHLCPHSRDLSCEDTEHLLEKISVSEFKHAGPTVSRLFRLFNNRIIELEAQLRDTQIECSSRFDSIAKDLRSDSHS